MFKKTLFRFITVCCLILSSLYAAELFFCPQIASYKIELTLDTESSTLDAHEILTWKNDTEEPTSEIWFHLYWNAFQNNRSTFLQERSRMGYDLPNIGKDDWGYCLIRSIKLVGDPDIPGEDLEPSLEYQQPDDMNDRDQTVFSVNLPRPVEPGETISLDIIFY